MKVGSIVECVKNDCFVVMIKPKLKQPYTVRGVIKADGATGIYLEEIINPIASPPYRQMEWAYNAECFRELLPPMEIQNALDECEPVLIELNKK